MARMMQTGATVEPFGSFVSNLYSKWGDLDISVELPNGSLISSAVRKWKLKLLKDIQKALQRRGSVLSSMSLYCIFLISFLNFFLGIGCLAVICS